MRVRSATAAFLALATLPAGAFAATILVPEGAPTIQAAVDQAQPGDEILVTRGKYPAPVRIFNKTGITLRGQGSTLDGRGESDCLSITNCTGVVVTGFKMKGAPSDICSVNDSTGGEISDCSFTGRKGTSGSGISVFRCTGLRLLRNRIKKAFYGMFVGDLQGNECTDCVVEGNSISKVADCGIRAFGSRNTFRGNKLKKTGSSAIYLSETVAGNDANVITGNTVKKSGDEGIFFSGTGATCSGNTVTATANDCFRVLGSGHTLEDNVAKSSKDDGYLVAATDCTLRRNQAIAPKDDGFDVTGGDNLLEENSASKAKDAGFQVESTGNTFRSNTATKSKDLGLDDRAGGNTYESNAFGTTNLP